jgi:glycosyltransferase involved in cell wall biosynthesis
LGEAFGVIFIANVLVMNGGSTFILRMARQFKLRGQRCIIILLRDLSDPKLLENLQSCAEIVRLSDFQITGRRFSLGLFGVFVPIDWRGLLDALRPYGAHVHAMSVFGLILALRIARADPAIRPTVGVYHQNEFVFQAPRFFFPRFVQKIFASMPQHNILFFNESSKDNYAAFFQRDYSNASLLPIGVEINEGATPRNFPSCRIVSIGNLAGFKTYNRHMIAIVAELHERLPNISYDIYGRGPKERELQDYVTELKMEGRVRINGHLEYSNFHKVVKDCDLFVGSGTALVEAAAAGRPALIGIESIETPETYGFLSDAEGFSYNELRAGVTLLAMQPLVERVLTDSKHWGEVAVACERKAHEFSIQRTINGFEKLFESAEPRPVKLRSIHLIRMACSAVLMFISEKLRLSEPFGDRRNQSY